MTNELTWQHGFGNVHMSQARTGALPQGQNSPQQPPYGLISEQISGTAFTKPRATNLHTWVYRLCPSVIHEAFTPAELPVTLVAPDWLNPQPPTQLRWDPLEIPSAPTDFLHGLIPMAHNGNCHAHYGCAVYLYACNQ